MTTLINTHLNRMTFPTVKLGSTLGCWAERAHQRKVLAKLNYGQLEDIGLSPKSAQKEASKPFWIG